MNNPLMAKDASGLKFIAVAKNSLPTNGYNYGFSNSPGFYSSNEFNMSRFENILNGFIDVWNNPNNRQYSPKVASYVKNTDIYVGLFKDEKYGGHAYAGYKDIYIGDVAIKGKQNDGDYLESALFHEAVHTMDSENGEFKTHAACFAAGYYKPEQILKRFASDEYKKSVYEDAPDEFKKYFDKNMNFIGKDSKSFWNAFFNLGQKIIK
jgi:hypothetical protein